MLDSGGVFREFVLQGTRFRHHRPRREDRRISAAGALDFDPDNLPPPVLSTLTEAVACHAAGAYRAAAMMVRRLLRKYAS